jgi:CarD family transcriptional regulator
MDFHIGDKVIHCTHGLGEIVQIEQKVIRDRLTDCYVVQISDMLIWIPVDDPQQQCLRLPARPDEFIGLSAILTGPGEPLQEDRLLRKDQLLTRMRDGQLTSICEVVRDLTQFKRVKKLNDQESSILERATNSLLTEWALSLGVSQNQAQLAMAHLLET